MITCLSNNDVNAAAATYVVKLRIGFAMPRATHGQPVRVCAEPANIAAAGMVADRHVHVRILIPIEFDLNQFSQVFCNLL